MEKDSWKMMHPGTQNPQTVGGSPKALLSYLTRFHQTTFHGMTAAKLAKEKPAAKPEHDLNNLTPRIENGHFLQGPVKFAVDVDDLFRTLSCGAFGIGQQQERHGILANLGETELKRFAEVNGLPAKPFARELLIEVLRCPLQDAWYKACYDPVVHPGLHDNPEKRAANFEARKQRFHTLFENYTRAAGEKAERLKASLANGNSRQHVFVKKPEGTWAATEKLTKKLVAEMNGQQKPILEWLLKNKGTKSEIAAAVAAKLTTKQKPELVVGHYLPEWKKKGWVTT